MCVNESKTLACGISMQGEAPFSQSSAVLTNLLTQSSAVMKHDTQVG